MRRCLTYPLMTNFDLALTSAKELMKELNGLEGDKLKVRVLKMILNVKQIF